MELLAASCHAHEILHSILPFCHRANIAGSIRRGKTHVKDIEIVAIIKDWQQLFTALTDFGMFIKPGVPEIEPWAPKVNAKYLRMMLNCGLKLDLFIASPENWGGLFMMRTGSGVGLDGKAFSGFAPTMFARWKKVSGGGRMINCMPTMPDGRKVIVREEEDFFKLLGVEFIEPEFRIARYSVRKIKNYELNLDGWEIAS